MIVQDENAIEIKNPFGNGTIHLISGFSCPMLIGKEIAECLGYSNTKDALAKHVSNENKIRYKIKVGNQMREVVLINRKGLITLSFKSEMPVAKQFCEWASNVLDTIANSGSYEISNSEEDQFANSILNPGMNQTEYADPYFIENRAKLSATIKNYCRIAKVIIPNAMREFINTYNILYRTNLKALTTRAYNAGYIPENNVFDYIDIFNEYEKALGAFSYMLNRFYYLDDYARIAGEPCYGHPAPEPQAQVIYNINNAYGVANNATAVSQEEINKFAIEHNWPYVVVQNGEPKMNICHKVNKNK